MKTYKTKKTVLKHVKKRLEDYHNWMQGGEFFYVPPGMDKNGPSEDAFPFYYEVPLEQRTRWMHNADEAREANKRCKMCVMGAVKFFSADPNLACEIIEDLDKEAKRRYPNSAIDAVFEVNDGGAHKTLKGAWKATLSIIDKVMNEV